MEFTEEVNVEFTEEVNMEFTEEVKFTLELNPLNE